MGDNMLTILSILTCASVFAAEPPLGGQKSYRTSTGAVFELVERKGFKTAIKAPNGAVWSEFQGYFENIGTSKDRVVTDSAAVRQCASVEAALPSLADYSTLKRYFELDREGFFTEQGRQDLHAVFPDMIEKKWTGNGYEIIGRWFWTSTGLDAYAVKINGFTGMFMEDWSRAATFEAPYHHSIRCIVR
jgi:hypothetical protein